MVHRPSLPRFSPHHPKRPSPADTFDAVTAEPALLALPPSDESIELDISADKPGAVVLQFPSNGRLDDGEGVFRVDRIRPGRGTDRPPGARPAGPLQRALADAAGQRGARAADRGTPGNPPEGRHEAAAAGLRRGQPMARRPVPQVRRPVHHASARGRDGAGEPRHGQPRPWSRRCCTTPSRTPTTPSTRCARSSAVRSHCWWTA